MNVSEQARKIRNWLERTAPTIIGMLACDSRGIIGSNGKMPWNIPSDRQLFRKVTQGSPLIMGRKTFESVPESFWSDKDCVIFSRRPRPSSEFSNIKWVSSLEEFKRLPALSTELQLQPTFMIGGAEIARMFLANNLLSHFVLTKMKAAYEGDAAIDLSALAGWSSEIIHDSANSSVLTAVRLVTKLQPKF